MGALFCALVVLGVVVADVVLLLCGGGGGVGACAGRAMIHAPRESATSATAAINKDVMDVGLDMVAPPQGRCLAL